MTISIALTEIWLELNYDPLPCFVSKLPTTQGAGLRSKNGKFRGVGAENMNTIHRNRCTARVFQIDRIDLIAIAYHRKLLGWAIPIKTRLHCITNEIGRILPVMRKVLAEVRAPIHSRVGLTNGIRMEAEGKCLHLALPDRIWNTRCILKRKVWIQMQQPCAVKDQLTITNITHSDTMTLCIPDRNGLEVVIIGYDDRSHGISTNRNGSDATAKQHAQGIDMQHRIGRLEAHRKYNGISHVHRGRQAGYGAEGERISLIDPLETGIRHQNRWRVSGRLYVHRKR